MPVDYSQHINWIHRPGPRERIKPVDVFFAYPTVYVHPDKKAHHLMPIGNPLFRTAARVSSWWHDRIFAETCNIFVPFYRQVGMETLFMRHAQFDQISHTPYEDLRDAFFYYLRYCNEGRPFFLGGHSQGSEILIRLMCRDFAGLEAASRMIAAYLIGYSVTETDLREHPHIRMAERADDTGVIISYNTSADGLELMPVVLPGAVAINPLNWSREPGHAGKDKNLGSVLLETRKFAIQRKHFTGARLDIDKGVVMIDPEALDELFHMHLGPLKHLFVRRHSLHTFDIALFQRNLEKNIKDRIAAFARQNPQYDSLSEKNARDI